MRKKLRRKEKIHRERRGASAKQSREHGLQHDACIRHVISTIHSLATLRSLELIAFRARDCSTADAVAQWISSATALTRLRLRHCTLQHAELQYPFAECLLPLTLLQCLSLHATCISRYVPAGSDVCEGVGEGQVEGGSKIEHEEIASMASSEEESCQASLIPLGQVVHALSSLTELEMSCYTIDSDSKRLADLAQRGTLLSRIQVLFLSCYWDTQTGCTLSVEFHDHIFILTNLLVLFHLFVLPWALAHHAWLSVCNAGSEN